MPSIQKSGARLPVSPTAHVYICLISCYPDCKSFTLQRGVFNLRVILNLIFIVIVFKIMILKNGIVYFMLSPSSEVSSWWGWAGRLAASETSGFEAAAWWSPALERVAYTARAGRWAERPVRGRQGAWGASTIMMPKLWYFFSLCIIVGRLWTHAFTIWTDHILAWYA